jgi:hypothetical protein
VSNRVNQDASSPFELTVPMKATLLSATGLLLLGFVFLYVETYNMMPAILPGYPGDAFFPRLVLGFCMIWAVILLVRGSFLSQEAAAAGYEALHLSLHWLEFVSVAVLVLLYAFLLEPVGFEVTTVVFLMVLLVPRLLAGPGARPARAVLLALALSLATMLILYLGLGPALKIALPLKFLPIYFQ